MCRAKYVGLVSAKPVHEILLAGQRPVLGAIVVVVVVVVVVVRIKHTAQAQFLLIQYLQQREEFFSVWGIAVGRVSYRTYHNPSAQTP